jgi:pimeloyl-ACP methyl ester carboxylesterase
MTKVDQPASLKTVESSDGRTLAFAEWGDPGGVPVLRLHGTPGCRLNRPSEEQKVREMGVRVVTFDRPGYGRSSRHRGRSVVDCVADVEAIADVLGLEEFVATGSSGGGPHVLALAARLPNRVLRVNCAVCIAPFDADGLDWLAGMDPENVAEIGWAVEGERTLTQELTREAERLQARVADDPKRMLETFHLPESDIAILADRRFQRVIREATAEMFANGPFGWVDDDLAFVKPWGFDVAEITVPVELHYGISDVLVPAAHGEWLAHHIPGVTVVAEEHMGHMADPNEAVEQLRRLAYGA